MAQRNIPSEQRKGMALDMAVRLGYNEREKGSRMDLELDIFRTSGRKAQPVVATVVRELTREDLVLRNTTELGVQASPIKRLSQRHHSLARVVASGVSMGEAAMVTGYDISRISILKDDPTFQELVKFYSEMKDKAYADLHTRLAGLAVEAAEQLQVRLEEKPDEISTGQLMNIIQLGADRTGFGPATKNTQVNINIGMADRLEAARRRVAERQGTVIEGEVVNGQS